MKIAVYIVMIIGSVCVLQSCGGSHNKPSKKTDIGSKAFQDKLIDANKMYVKKESDEIDQYVKRKEWDMITTGTGLRYMIIKKGTGELAKEDSSFNKFAKVKFKVSLLNGTICYSSDSTGLREFMIGQDDVETGVHEGIQYMHVGDVARFILPSHLAYGLMGDQRKIPPKSSVLYDIELLSLRKIPKK